MEYNTRMKKTIGILGGMGPESTVDFYNQIVTLYHSQFHNYAFPKMIIATVDFDEIIRLQESKDMSTYTSVLLSYIQTLENAGVDFIVIPSNTPHMVFPEISQKAKVPMLSIVNNTAVYAKENNFKRLLLLGTKYTMTSDFYKNDFHKFGIDIRVPDQNDIDTINKIIFNELVLGNVIPYSKKLLIEIIDKLDVDGCILGCTELGLIIKPEDITIPTLDTLKIHAIKTLEYALQE